MNPTNHKTDFFFETSSFFATKRHEIVQGAGMNRRLSRMFTLMIALIATGALPLAAWGANGDIEFSVPHCQSSGQVVGAADIAYDTVADELFVADLGTGEICRYTLSAFPPDIASASMIPNPFGDAGFPVPTNTTVGVAFDPSGSAGAGSLYVLNANNMMGIRVRQADKATGLQIGGDILVQTPDASSSPRGLTYDPTGGGSLWYRDTANNMLVNIDLTGAIIATVAIPGVQQKEFVVGSALHYLEVGADRFIDITFGNLIDFQVQKTVRINVATGASEPQEVNLAQLYDAMVGGDADSQTNPITGLAIPPTGGVIYVCTQESVYKVDSVQPSSFPPTNFTCFSQPDGSIQLNWQNNGMGAGGAYNTIFISRIIGGSALVSTEPGSAMTYTDTAITDPANPELLDTTFDYEVEAVDTNGTPVQAVCRARTGRGALLGFTSFDGVAPFDIAYNPNTDELFVTDNTTYSSGSPGRIYVYNTTLQFQRVININVGNVQGICYDTDQDRLVISAGPTFQQQTLRIIDPNTGVEQQSFPVNIPLQTSPRIGPITYDTVQRDYLFVNLNTDEVVRVEAEDNGMPLVLPTPGSFVSSCLAPFTSFSRGITFLESGGDGSFLATIQGSNPGETATQITQYLADADTCLEAPGAAGVPLNEMGGSLNQANAVNGILDLGNVIYVANGLTRTVFRLLLAPALEFVRGDANEDGSVNVADVSFIAGYLFVPASPVPGCLDAADTNDDGNVDISDATYLLFDLFVPGSPPPPAPHPNPGPDLTFLDGLGC